MKEKKILRRLDVVFRLHCALLQVNTAPKLVLLDVGMVAELTPEDQQNLVGFFKVRHLVLTHSSPKRLGHLPDAGHMQPTSTCAEFCQFTSPELPKRNRDENTRY